MYRASLAWCIWCQVLHELGRFCEFKAISALAAWLTLLYLADVRLEALCSLDIDGHLDDLFMSCTYGRQGSR